MKFRVETHFESKRERRDNFTSRTLGALNKIAEEHWKRQMQQEQKEEQLVSNLKAYDTNYVRVSFLAKSIPTLWLIHPCNNMYVQ